MKRLMYKFSGALAALALLVTSMSVNSACIFWLHQPKIPEAAKKLQKIYK